MYYALVQGCTEVFSVQIIELNINNYIEKYAFVQYCNEAFQRKPTLSLNSC